MDHTHATFEPVIADLSAPALAIYRKLKALDRVHDRAEQRINWGAHLFGIAEARATRGYHMIQDLKAEQAAKDASKSHPAAWTPAPDATASLPAGDDGVTTAIKSLEAKMARLQGDWARTQARIAEMMRQSETLLR